MDKKGPTCLDTLKVAIEKRAGELPLEMTQNALMSFRKREKLCIRGGGGVFAGRRLAGDDAPPAFYGVANIGDGEEEEDDEEGAEGEEEIAK